MPKIVSDLKMRLYWFTLCYWSVAKKPLQNFLHMASICSLLPRAKASALMFSLSAIFFNLKIGFDWKKLFHLDSSCEKLKSIQYKAALTTAIQSTFREKLNKNWVWKHSDLADCRDVLPVCSNLRKIIELSNYR